MKVFKFITSAVLLTLSISCIAQEIKIIETYESALGYSKIKIKASHNSRVKCVIYDKQGNKIGERRSWMLAPVDEVIILKDDKNIPIGKAECEEGQK